jgi:hypothetical protein
LISPRPELMVNIQQVPPTPFASETGARHAWISITFITSPTHLNRMQFCGNNMRLAYVDPTGTSTVYAYRCDDGHHHEILRADIKRGASVVGLAIGKSGIGPVSSRSALTGDLPPSSVTQRLALNLSDACVVAERRAGKMRPTHSACFQYARVDGIQ